MASPNWAPTGAAFEEMKDDFTAAGLTRFLADLQGLCRQAHDNRCIVFLWNCL